MKIMTWLILITTAMSCALTAGEKSPISDDIPSRDSSPAAMAAAEERGAAAAAKDIKAGKLRILYYGIPRVSGKDRETGYPELVVGGCCVTEVFVAEVDAYNQAMRAWHAKTNKTTEAKPEEKK